MRSVGYTLIELLIAISILSILAVVGFVNFKDFASDQVAVKAKGQIQTLLRLAQSNATSSTLCDNKGVLSWSLKFTDATTIELRCSNPADYLHRSYPLENAEIDQIKGSACGDVSTIPITLSYSPGVGVLTFSASGVSETCLKSTSWRFTIKNLKNNALKSFNISKGGAIDVQ